MAKKQKYEEAVRRLEEIVEKINDENIDIDSLGEYIKEAQKLIAVCKERLEKTETDIRTVLDKGAQ